jgi:hypothetical protein
MGVFLGVMLPTVIAQVGPAEIKNPDLKAAEKAYLQQLLTLNRAISELKFPLKFSLNRYVGLDPKDQIGADTRGLEFVNFHERQILKFTGNYNAAFNAAALTANQRASRVLGEVILPMLRILPSSFSEDASFDGFGFEIGYHVQRHNNSYNYEGKEILVVVFSKSDGLRYAHLGEDAARQEILNHSEVFLNGKPFGLALNVAEPFEIEALVRRPVPNAKIDPAVSKNSPQIKAMQTDGALASPKPETQPPTQTIPAKTAMDVPLPASHAGHAEIDALQKKYLSELERWHGEGMAKYHFVDYAPPGFIVFRDQLALQATLRNPDVFDKESTSIYKRAARTFDLFLAPQLRGILEKIPESPDFGAVDFSVVNDLISSKSAKTSEAIEFVFPLKAARQFAAADITNQDLINQSVVLVNGVRISLNLAQVE